MGKPVASIGLFKDKTELVDFKKVADDGKKDAKGGYGTRSKKGSDDDKKKKGKKSKGKKSKSKGGKDGSGKKDEEKKGPGPTPANVSDFGFNARTSSIFSPATIALVYK